MMKAIKIHLIFILSLALLLLSGCSSLTRLDAVPQEQLAEAKIPGLENIRYRVGLDTEAMTKEGATSVRQEMTWRNSKGLTGPLPAVHFLAISGGGDKGAFAAGLLNGWSKSKTRPEFKLVTGISTGALIAPFAFLGEKYDAHIKDFYTNTKPKDIFNPRGVLAAIFSDAMADNNPLWKRLKKEINRTLLDEIAEEYKKGRLLLIGTTDLDARRGVIWNMTKIASSKDPRALHLFRSIIIASTAIPGAFPPVMIDVEIDGKKHQEMHVDGGTVAQVFVYPPAIKLQALTKSLNAQRERNLYIIRNSRLDPDWANTERQVLSIAKRAISSLIHTQGMGDLYRIYATSQRDGVAYNLAYIPASFNEEHHIDFDTKYMRALYNQAYKLSVNGYKWKTTPPSLD